MQKNTCRYVQDTYTYTYRILTCKYMILTCQYQILTRQYHIRTVHIGPYLHVSARIFINVSLLLPPASICFRLLPIITTTSSASLCVRKFIPINRPQAQQQAVNHPICCRWCSICCRRCSICCRRCSRCSRHRCSGPGRPGVIPAAPFIRITYASGAADSLYAD